MLRKRTKATAITLGLALLLASCGGDNNSNTSDALQEGSNSTNENTSDINLRDDIDTSEKDYKDEIHIAMTAQPPTLDAALTSSNAANGVAGHIFEQLYTMNEQYEPTPELATGMTLSDDELVYTFSLREGVRFHNGNEMTADDVVASMNRWLNASARAKTLLPDAVFEKVDDYTVDFTVKEATSDVMTILSSRMLFPAIMPKELMENPPAEGVEDYIGTGPYKLNNWQTDQYIHLVRYEDYEPVSQSPSAYAGRKDAPTENLYFHFVSDHATRIAGLKTGEYDVAESVPLENYDEIVGEDNITAYTKPSGSLNLFFNTQQGLLADVSYRQAILAALDCNEIMYASYTNEAHYTLDPGYMNIDQPQWATKAGAEYYNQADPEKAKKLLEEAGYNNETIRLLTTPDYQEMYAATTVVQEQLRQIGVNAEITSFDFSTFMETKDDLSKWDIVITSNSYNIIPPQILAVNPDWAGFDEPEVPEYLAAIRSAGSDEEAAAVWAELQQFMYEFASSTTLGHYNSAMAASSALEDFVYFDHTIYWNAKIAQ